MTPSLKTKIEEYVCAVFIIIVLAGAAIVGLAFVIVMIVFFATCTLHWREIS